jgi:hypothetical protein
VEVRVAESAADLCARTVGPPCFKGAPPPNFRKLWLWSEKPPGLAEEEWEIQKEAWSSDSDADAEGREEPKIPKGFTDPKKKTAWQQLGKEVDITSKQRGLANYEPGAESAPEFFDATVERSRETDFAIGAVEADQAAACRHEALTKNRMAIRENQKAFWSKRTKFWREKRQGLRCDVNSCSGPNLQLFDTTHFAGAAGNVHFECKIERKGAMGPVFEETTPSWFSREFPEGG